MNSKLFLHNPEDSELGKKILKHSIILIHKIGFEAFTFKKLATQIKTTEAGVYRYFENKQRLLLYLVDWYWNWQEYRLTLETKNIANPETKLKKAIGLLANEVQDDKSVLHISEKLLYQIVMTEGAKSYLTKNVAEDNKNKLFKPYKDLCARIASLILECNPKYNYPRSLSSTIIEMAHSQNYYLKHLPSLTDVASAKETFNITSFLESIVFSSIKSNKKRI